MAQARGALYTQRVALHGAWCGALGSWCVPLYIRVCMCANVCMCECVHVCMCVRVYVLVNVPHCVCGEKNELDN